MFDDADIFLIKTRSVRTQMNFVTKNWNLIFKERKRKKRRKKHLLCLHLDSKRGLRDIRICNLLYSYSINILIKKILLRDEVIAKKLTHLDQTKSTSSNTNTHPVAIFILFHHKQG